MSESSSTSFSFGGLFFATFIVVKVWGTALAGWSWWWFLLSFIPVTWLICSKLGLLSPL